MWISAIWIPFEYFYLGETGETDDATTQAQDDQEYEYGNYYVVQSLIASVLHLTSGRWCVR